MMTASHLVMQPIVHASAVRLYADSSSNYLHLDATYLPLVSSNEARLKLRWRFGFAAVDTRLQRLWMSQPSCVHADVNMHAAVFELRDQDELGDVSTEL